MKKIFSLIALAIGIGFTACTDDESVSNLPSNFDIKGSWYEEAENEEMRFGDNGTFYDRYANYLSCAESEGRWELDSKNSKLTYWFTFMGQTQCFDWTVKNPQEYSFTISSETVADHILERIVESYVLEVGETATIAFPQNNSNYSVVSYSSNNERIASVTPEGVIRAEGEKGITYIKIKTPQTNVWVKVTVGDNCSEMWHDYIGLLGLDYGNMTQALSRLGNPYSGEDGYSFGFIHEHHDIIDITKVFMCPDCGIVTEIQLLMKESVPEAQILSYMNSRYYKVTESGTILYYSSNPQLSTSKATIAYDKSKRCVYFLETQHFLYPHMNDLWVDLIPLFGSGKDVVKSTMDEYGYSFLMSDYNYSKDGSDYYAITGNDYANMVGFVFNPDQQMSEYWIYLNTKSNPNEIYDYLKSKYKEYETESTESSLVFYNEDKSLKVTFDLKNAAVVYTKLTMKQYEANSEILGDYYEGLGLTHDQIVEKYGTPYQDDGSIMYYIVGSEYVNLAAFRIDAETGKCKNAMLSINENVSTSTIVDYLGAKYTVFTNGTAEDGSRYAWINGQTVTESTLGILYYPEDRIVSYQPLGSAANTRPLIRSIERFTNDISLVKTVSTRTSAFLNNSCKNKERIVMHQSNRLDTIIEKYKK